MTIAQLRAFLAALEHGSFTAAARELDATQASVSELIARLERELGTQLFTRGSRRLVPTAAAAALRGYAEQAVGAIDGGVQTIRAINALDGGTCTFGALRNASYYELSELVERFHRQYPRVTVRLVGLNSALVAEAVAAGEIEAGLIVLPIDEPGLTITPLFRDEVLFASARRSPASAPVSIDQVCRARLVLYDAHAGWRDPTRRQLRERAHLRGLTVEPAIEVEHVETALSLVSSGAAETIVSRTVAEAPSFPAEITAVPFAEPFYETIALIQREDAYLSPATRRLAELAQQMLLDRVREHAGRMQTS